MRPSSSAPEFIYEKNRSMNLKRCLHPGVQSSSTHSCQVSIDMDKWMKRQRVRYTHKLTQNGILLSHEKEQDSAFTAPWMDLGDITPSQINQTQKATHHISLIYGI